MSYVALRDNLARVREEIARVQANHRLTGVVRIVGITKGHPVEAVRAARAAGLTDVGENRVHEAIEKQAAPDLDVRWHLVGHLQTNKAKRIAGRFSAVHSVDSVRVVDALENTAVGTEKLEVLVQVNVAGEEQKFGCAPMDARPVLERVRDASHLALRGLMTMAPFTDDEVVQRRTFAALREVRDSLTGEGLELPELSMGMSGDYRSAVAEGATMLRLGTVLFGRRSA